MTEPAVARPPLEQQTLPRIDGVGLKVVQPREIINLRGNAGDERFRNAVAAATDAVPPTEPNTWATAEGAAMLWAGPDEWLLVVEPDGPEARLEALRGALGEQSAAVTSVRVSYAVVELTGERARDVLARGTPLDLHPRVFAPGQCAQTRLAHATVVLWQIDDTPAFRLMIRRSMAGYLRDWLTAVAARMAVLNQA